MTPFLVPEPDLQIEFYRRLEAIRESWLIDVLLSTVSRLDISQVDRELAEFVSPPAMQEVAGWGLRGEILLYAPDRPSQAISCPTAPSQPGCGALTKDTAGPQQAGSPREPHRFR